MKWCTVSCAKCGKKFDGQYRQGTEVFCNKCNKWIVVGEEESGGRGQEV